MIAWALFNLLLGVLLWMFYGPYQRLRLAEARYRLFVIRDRLFDAAARGEAVWFEDRAYGMARTTLNGMLRTLEGEGAVRWLIILWRLRRSGSELAKVIRHERDFRHALGELSPEGRRLVQRATEDAMEILFAHIVSVSLCLRALALLQRLLRLLQIKPTPWRFLRGSRVRAAVRYQSNSAGHWESGYAHVT